MLLLCKYIHFRMCISGLLTSWYLVHKRDLPWRESTRAYTVWLSEIILQQTRVNQGIEYYYRFVEHYPTIEDLAAAPEDEVLKLWQGLGYYSRARNLLKTAKDVVAHCHGKFPENYDELLKLKGIGDYTASAIASISFGQPNAVVDGNVYRVLSRLFAIDTPINTSAGQKIFKQKAQELLDTQQPGTYNQAIMEFGALYCLPQNPDCPNCILKNDCQAYKHEKVSALPVKEKKARVRHRYFNFLMVLYNKGVYIEKRTEKDIWENLFQLPLIETEKEVDILELQELPQWQPFYNLKTVTIKIHPKKHTHILSHQKLHARLYLLTIQEPLYMKGWIFVSLDDIRKFAVPRLIEKFFQETGLYK